MREMKDSGIADISQTYNLKRLKYVFKIKDECRKPITADKRTQNSDVLYDYYGASGIIDKIDGYTIDDDVLLIGEDGANLRMRNLPLVYEVHGKAWINNHAHILKPSEELYFRYALYMLESLDINPYITGSAQPKFNQEALQNLYVIVPPISEQTRIGDFLDAKCAEIDALTADIQAQIDTLEQYKRSVITEAVTKGLNPDAEMRDSGLRWVERLPAHWAVIPSKHLFHNSDLRKQPDDVLLTASQNWGIIPQEEYMERTGAKIVLANHGLENWKHVEPNDFVISLRSFQGGLEMSTVRGCITWHYIVLKPVKPINHRFYKWLFKSDAYISALQSTCNFIRDGQDLRYSNFSQVPLYVPPLAEQTQIADYLDNKCSEIDSIIAEKNTQKSVLADYKKSLIFEYVTGKKEVPAS